MRSTIVFQKIWDALNARTDDGARRYRYIVLKGSSRSSKTRSLLQVYYLYAIQNSKKRMSVWRDVAKDCRDTVGYDMNLVYPDHEGWGSVSFNQTRFVYTFPTKSVIEITGTDDPNKVHGYQGDVIWLNEPYDISRPTFDQLDMRTTDVVFIDYNPKQSHWVEDIINDPRTIVIHSTFRDNPFCPPEQRKKILGYQPVSKCSFVVANEKLAREEGKLTELEAFAYDVESNPMGFTSKQIKELIRCRLNEDNRTANAYNWDVYGLGIKAEKPHRIFHWQKIPVEQYRQLNAREYFGVDWGTNDPWGILSAKWYDGALYLRQRNYKSENTIRGELTATERAIVAGQETERENQESTGIVTFMFEKLAIPRNCDIVCDSNRPRKGNALRKAGWQPWPAAKGPGSIKDGIDILQSIRVYFTDDSPDLEYEQENYSWKVDKYGKVEDEPEDTNNHLMDPSRYVVQHLQQLGIINVV